MWPVKSRTCEAFAVVMNLSDPNASYRVTRVQASRRGMTRLCSEALEVCQLGWEWTTGFSSAHDAIL